MKSIALTHDRLEQTPSDPTRYMAIAVIARALDDLELARQLKNGRVRSAALRWMLYGQSYGFWCRLARIPEKLPLAEAAKRLAEMGMRDSRLSAA